jgi:hypothetical protein
MIRSLLWFIILFQLSYGLAEAGKSPKIDFDKILFLSNWTQSGKVQLVNGEYREQAVPGSAMETVVKLTDAMAFGKLEGKEAGAVVLVTGPGVSG